MGLFAALGVLFVALKLTGVIAWSWWLVTLPFYGGFLLVISIVSLVAIFSSRN